MAAAAGGGAGSPLAAAAAAAAGITEEIALSRLDEAATQLQKEGRYMEALECMERGLVLRQRMFGVQSDEVRSRLLGGGGRATRRLGTRGPASTRAFPPPLGWRPRPRCPTPRHPHPLPQVWAACKSAAELCNLLSMSYLQKRACPQRHL